MGFTPKKVWAGLGCELLCFIISVVSEQSSRATPCTIYSSSPDALIAYWCAWFFICLTVLQMQWKCPACLSQFLFPFWRNRSRREPDLIIPRCRVVPRGPLSRNKKALLRSSGSPLEYKYFPLSDFPQACHPAKIEISRCLNQREAVSAALIPEGAVFSISFYLKIK